MRLERVLKNVNADRAQPLYERQRAINVRQRKQRPFYVASDPPRFRRSRSQICVGSKVAG
jgi:hypothetical protein